MDVVIVVFNARGLGVCHHCDAHGWGYGRRLFENIHGRMHGGTRRYIRAHGIDFLGIDSNGPPLLLQLYLEWWFVVGVFALGGVEAHRVCGFEVKCVVRPFTEHDATRMRF